MLKDGRGACAPLIFDYCLVFAFVVFVDFCEVGINNIVIRSAVLTPESTSIGAGGAIVAMSDAAAEYEEMLLKARPVLAAVAEAATGDPENVDLDTSSGIDEF